MQPRLPSSGNSSVSASQAQGLGLYFMVGFSARDLRTRVFDRLVKHSADEPEPKLISLVAQMLLSSPYRTRRPGT